MNAIKSALIPRLMRYGSKIPDSQYLRLLFYLKMGYWPNMKNPRTFSEKLQWLKLHDRRPEYTTMVDKCSVKEYVSNIIGGEHVIPTIDIWKNAEDIEWEKLPNQFVLKTTHGGGSGGVIICKDKNSLERDAVISKLNKSLQQDIYKEYREWPYKNVLRQILAEPYLTNDGHPLVDYKIHNFNGKPEFILLCRNRYGENGMTDDFYSPEWEHLELKRPGHENPGGQDRPQELNEMLDLARQLSKGIPFLRTDFYIINNKVYFGELTFYPASGMSHFEPDIWDIQFGEKLKLDNI